MSDSATPVQSPKHPAADLSNLPTSSLPTSPPDTCSNDTVEIQARMRKRHGKRRALGDTSCTDSGFDDVVEGRQTFTRGLSRLSDALLRKAYISKVASNRTILHRIALSQANIDALERRNEFFRGVKKEATAELAMNIEELNCIRNILGSRGINEADIERQHVVCADNLPSGSGSGSGSGRST